MRYALIFSEYDFFPLKSFEDLRKITNFKTPDGRSSLLYITDGTGKVQLQFACWEQAVTLYASSSISLKSFSDWTLFKAQLPTFIQKVSEGKWYCDSCGKWKSKGRFKHYSFAGIVCEKCYNPTFHTPPDTRGD